MDDFEESHSWKEISNSYAELPTSIQYMLIIMP